MQATRQDLYLHSRFADLNSFMVVVFAIAAAVAIAGTFVGALSQLAI